MERFGMDADEMLVVVTLNRQLTVQIDYFQISSPQVMNDDLVRVIKS